jgi:hypothetical protein
VFSDLLKDIEEHGEGVDFLSEITEMPSLIAAADSTVKDEQAMSTTYSKAENKQSLTTPVHDNRNITSESNGTLSLNHSPPVSSSTKKGQPQRNSSIPVANLSSEALMTRGVEKVSEITDQVLKSSRKAIVRRKSKHNLKGKYRAKSIIERLRRSPLKSLIKNLDKFKLIILCIAAALTHFVVISGFQSAVHIKNS